MLAYIHKDDKHELDNCRTYTEFMNKVIDLENRGKAMDMTSLMGGKTTMWMQVAMKYENNPDYFRVQVDIEYPFRRDVVKKILRIDDDSIEMRQTMKEMNKDE